MMPSTLCKLLRTKSWWCAREETFSDNFPLLPVSAPPYRRVVAMANMMVVSQPGVVLPAVSSSHWSTGVFDCFEDLPSCCFGFWCFWCFTCRTSREYGECLCLPLVDFFGLGGCVPAIAMAMRAEMRQRYGIRGSLVEDFGYSFFLAPCVYCQMSREMKARQLATVTILHSNPSPYPR
ncbi:hypothetical protein ACEWY4_024800 [Coilia grayii]|uniref:Uncharacterized protein n=1 Tax=Coilia grayii TaxID=363190 RepID=A0ABD1IYU9_9TELE